MEHKIIYQYGAFFPGIQDLTCWIRDGANVFLKYIFEAWRKCYPISNKVKIQEWPWRKKERSRSLDKCTWWGDCVTRGWRPSGGFWGHSASHTKGTAWWGISVSLRNGAIGVTCKQGLTLRGVITKVGLQVGFWNYRSKWKSGRYSDHSEWWGLSGGQEGLTNRELYELLIVCSLSRN